MMWRRRLRRSLRIRVVVVEVGSEEDGFSDIAPLNLMFNVSPICEICEGIEGVSKRLKESQHHIRGVFRRVYNLERRKTKCE